MLPLRVMVKFVLWGDAMAQKRMFSLKIVETDKFLDMPVSAQCLYFHLGMHGDDDGFVANPKRVTSLCGCNPDDLKLLVTKGFIIPFDSGVCVIKDWRVNNDLKNDRYRPTLYSTEKATLAAMYPECIQDGSKMFPQHNITKHNKTKSICAASQPKTHTIEFTRFWEAYPKKKDKTKARKAFEKALKQTDLDTMLQALEAQKRSPDWQRDGGQYIPLPTTWLNGCRWEDEVTEPETAIFVPRAEHIPEIDW